MTEFLREMGANLGFITHICATLIQLPALLRLHGLIYKMFLTLKIIMMHAYNNPFKISAHLCFRQVAIHVSPQKAFTLPTARFSVNCRECQIK